MLPIRPFPSVINFYTPTWIYGTRFYELLDSNTQNSRCEVLLSRTQQKVTIDIRNKVAVCPEKSINDISMKFDVPLKPFIFNSMINFILKGWIQFKGKVDVTEQISKASGLCKCIFQMYANTNCCSAQYIFKVSYLNLF